jgi:purine-nucleoside phosphorylase
VGTHYEQLAKAADVVAARLGRGSVGVVLGSGLSEALDSVDRPQFMEYEDIPNMPGTATAGHPGSLLHGYVDDVPVLALCGRIHAYEGRPLSDVAFGVRLLSLLGVHTLLVTSAVGSADPSLPPGHLCLIEDHLNFSGVNVLAGEEEERLGPRFPDLTGAYDPEVLRVLSATAQRAGLAVGRGVLAQFHGPSYETPAEVHMARQMGARVIGMSMVPEVVAARQRGLRTGGIATVTNFAAGLQPGALSHEDVLRMSAASASSVQSLLAGAIPQLGQRTAAGARSRG